MSYASGLGMETPSPSGAIPPQSTLEPLETPMKPHAIALAPILALALGGVATADVLWDQSEFDPFGAGYFDSESGAPPLGITMHAVSDVTVGGAGWMIDSITTYYTGLDPAWGPAITQGYLHVFSKTDVLPGAADDPTASPLVTMAGSWDAGTSTVSATDLALELEPGDYWIGITPIAPSGPFGPEFHLSSVTLLGDPTASYDAFAPGWFVQHVDLDATILIEGAELGSTPVEAVAWSRIKSLYAR